MRDQARGRGDKLQIPDAPGIDGLRYERRAMQLGEALHGMAKTSNDSLVARRLAPLAKRLLTEATMERVARRSYRPVMSVTMLLPK